MIPVVIQWILQKLFQYLEISGSSKECCMTQKKWPSKGYRSVCGTTFHSTYMIIYYSVFAIWGKKITSWLHCSKKFFSNVYFKWADWFTLLQVCFSVASSSSSLVFQCSKYPLLNFINHFQHLHLLLHCYTLQLSIS